MGALSNEEHNVFAFTNGVGEPGLFIERNLLENFTQEQLECGIALKFQFPHQRTAFCFTTDHVYPALGQHAPE
jgi:hypothetical protein